MQTLAELRDRYPRPTPPPSDVDEYLAHIAWLAGQRAAMATLEALFRGRR